MVFDFLEERRKRREGDTLPGRPCPHCDDAHDLEPDGFGGYVCPSYGWAEAA